MAYEYIVFNIISIFLIIIGFIIILYHNIIKDKLCIFDIVIIVLGFCFYCWSNSKINMIEKQIAKQKYEQIEANINNGYDVYLDGVKINPDTIIISDYNAIIKDDLKIIILTKD